MEPRPNEEDLLFEGKNIHCRNKPLFRWCGDPLVYRGYFKKAEDLKEEIVVRKIKKTDCDDKWGNIFNKHNRDKDSIKHENVLKIISYEEMDEWRYFALERYDATLEHFCKGLYGGPMPSDAQVLCQIIKGLLYLHKEQCTHGNLTPRTILIASSQPVGMMIKLSEFGLSKFGDRELYQQDLYLRKYWRLNGTTKSNQQTPTPNQDIFAAGCLCFYFLKRGVHPFGSNTSSILENIKKRNPVNLLQTEQQEKGIWEFAYDPIKNMIGDPPTDGTNWLMIAEASFMKTLPVRFEEKKENELGSGRFGVVYRGTFEGNAVAVKVHLDDALKKEQKREMEIHLRLDHKNVLKLLHVDDSRAKAYLVLELCAGTLTDYCEKKYKEPMPPDGIVLYQIANGLHYIHSQNLVHRDVKPDNILISMTPPVQMKLSDFGFVKKSSPRGTLIPKSATANWIAPEILELLYDARMHGTIQSDTFAAGCVFFYFLTRGKHPFGDSWEIPVNVLHKNPKELNNHKQNLRGDDRALYELIGKMVKMKKERISLPEVIQQLTAKLYASRQSKKFEKSMSGIGDFVNRFHPSELVLACGGEDKLIFLSADNSSIPFSNWKEKETQLETGIFGRLETLEWNEVGTQLAAIFNKYVIVCWSYPSGEILFQKKILNEEMDHIKWNPFRPNMFATFNANDDKFRKVVSFFNSCPIDQRPFHFCTIKCENKIASVRWISENRVALGLFLGEGIEIWEIDESTATAKIVKQFEHKKDWIEDMAWDEKTKCLAACSRDGWIQIWSMDSDQPIHTTKVDGICLSLAWRPNRKPTDDDEGVEAARKSADNFILACGLYGGKIVIWNPLAEKTRILSQHSCRVDSMSFSFSSMSFSPDGRFLASGDDEGKFVIWSTENWEPVYIGKGKWDGPFSWLSSSSTDVPDYKLTFDSYYGKVRVVEYAVGQSEKPSKDGKNVPNEECRTNKRNWQQMIID